MVTVHRAFGFRFVIFVNDHAPPHVHVFGHGGEAKMELAECSVSVKWVNGIGHGELRRIVAEGHERRTMLLNAWKSIHG
jgi:hypothetical protein